MFNFTLLRGGKKGRRRFRAEKSSTVSLLQQETTHAPCFSSKLTLRHPPAHIKPPLVRVLGVRRPRWKDGKCCSGEEDAYSSSVFADVCESVRVSVDICVGSAVKKERWLSLFIRAGVCSPSEKIWCERCQIAALSAAALTLSQPVRQAG